MSHTTILIVEDEPLLSAMIRMSLRKGGYNILGPASGVEEAISLIEDTKPDCVTLDYQLRDGTSERVAQKLDSLNIPFVLCTGNPDKAACAIGNKQNDIVGKPFAQIELLQAVKSALNE